MAASTFTFDLILLFGPPIPHKEQFVPSGILSSAHTIVCPEKLYEENPNYGLRDIALFIVASLRQNTQVVVVDELHVKAQRLSLIKTVKNKVPSCQIHLIQILPKYGFLQCMWQWQCAYASEDTSVHVREENVKNWFSSCSTSDINSDYVQAPCEEEGYSTETVTVPLRINSFYKFEAPALFLQWEDSLDNDEHLVQISNICLRWFAENVNGRIIFIHDGRINAKGAITDTQKNTKGLCQLAIKVNQPIYAIQRMSASSGNFSLPPQPGLIAFLQQRHLIHLHSKRTYYLYNSIEHQQMAQAVGIQCHKISAVIKKPELLFKDIGLPVTVPEMLRTMTLVKPTYIATEHSTLSVPLFDVRHKEENNHISQNIHGLTEHVFIKDMQSFIQYQDSFQKQLTPIDQQPKHSKAETNFRNTSSLKLPTKTIHNEKKDFDPPVWMKKKKQSHPTSSSTSFNNEGTSKAELTDFSHRSMKTVYFMSEKEVMEMSLDILKQHGQDK
ncbi:uncharacterized protein LOC131935928 [Physella acuta]|uniref:uncharacterized protein LOC131935928 n=1 Tax=Physella acuta TaxID=109671 RepID=UPI0027DD0649|nr:uncharacterized protein LOC131935928 [Physella acuta]